MNRNSGSNYEYIKRLSTEKLEEILRLTGGEPPTEEDDALAGAVIAELLRREEGDAGPQIDVDQAWRDFQTKFNTPDAEPRVELAAAPVPARRKRRPWAVLAAALLLLCTAVVPPALGYENVFQMFGVWNSEHFTFLGDGSGNGAPPSGGHQLPEPDVEYATMEEALDAYGITEPVMPVIPEGFELVELAVFPMDDDWQVNINAFYIKDEGTETVANLSIGISQLSEDHLGSGTYEKDDEPVELYEAGGIVHHMFSNSYGKREAAVWIRGNLQCSIHTTMSRDELKELVNSIYEKG